MHDGSFLIELVNGVPVVAAPEEIDMANAPELGSALLEAAANGPGTVVADMTRTQYCDSAGIHTLLAAHKRARADGGKLLLVVPDAAVLQSSRSWALTAWSPTSRVWTTPSRTSPTDQAFAGPSQMQ